MDPLPSDDTERRQNPATHEIYISPQAARIIIGALGILCVLSIMGALGLAR